MAASEIVKLCLTKMAILFTHAAAQVDLGAGKRHSSVEWTHDREISRKIPSRVPCWGLQCPGRGSEQSQDQRHLQQPAALHRVRSATRRSTWRQDLSHRTQGSCCSETHWHRFCCPFSGHLLCLLQKPDLYVFAFLLDILLKYCFCL